MTQPRNTSRPFTARSVLASTLLGIDPPWLPTLLLVQSGELFGLSPGTVRTAISRMAASGELEPVGDGYRLAGGLLDRHARQQASRAARSDRPKRWSGDWEMAVVVADRRSAADRTALREAMRRLKLAEWREGVWLRPANLDAGRTPEEWAVADDQCRRLVARPSEDPGKLAAELWDLDAWADEAHHLAATFTPLVAPLERGDTSVLAEGFVVSAAVLRHFLHDPELPVDLLPDSWPGDELRRDYDRFDRAYKDVWRNWFAAQYPPGAGGRA